MKGRIIKKPRATTIGEYGPHQILRCLATFSEISFASLFFRGFAWRRVALVVLPCETRRHRGNRNRQRTWHRAPVLMSATRECAAQFYRAFAAVLLRSLLRFSRDRHVAFGKSPAGEAYALSRLNKVRKSEFRSVQVLPSVPISWMNVRVARC